MLTLQNLHGYQVRAANHLLEHPNAFIWGFLGCGKTIMTLSAIAQLLHYRAARGALVIGPTRVVQSGWASEAKKWEHTKHLRFQLLQGERNYRTRALFKPADVYLVNYEGIGWLMNTLQRYFIDRGHPLPFDILVYDESPRVKNPETVRAQALIPFLQYFPRRWGLTGTPASNGLEDLFGQFLMVDGGRTFGIDRQSYLSAYFTAGGYNGYGYTPTEDGRRHIYQNAAAITLELEEKDYSSMPDLIMNDIYVDLLPKHRAQYEEVEMQLFTELDNGVQLEIEHPQSKSNKLLQLGNGAVFVDTETREWHPVHDAKLDALQEVMEETGGAPVLVAYNYTPDAERIQKRFKYAVNLSGMSGCKFNETLNAWRAGQIRMLLGHPASLAEGVDGLQDAGHHMVWFGLNWSLMLYTQFNGRLRRTGQQHPVICHRILARDTFDDVVKDVLGMKAVTQADLRRAVGEYRKRKQQQQPV
jgi:SNF2 family DNA or RNA helicase